jgi:hypothetical protein
VSLLLDHGHQYARHYPIGMVWEEAQIVVQRINQELASSTALLQIAGSAVMSKPGAKALQKVLKELTSE